MRSKKNGLLLMALAACMAIGFAGCNEQGSSGDKNPDSTPGAGTEIETVVTTIEISQKTLQLYAGESYQLSYTSNSTETAAWRSADENIITVNQDGMVTAIRAGTCQVSVCIDEKMAVCTVTVLENTGVITVSSDAILMEFGDTFELAPSFEHNGEPVEDITYEYSFSKEGIVSVANGVITAIGNGEVEVTVSCMYEGVKIEKVVSVNVKEDIAVLLETAQTSLYVVDEAGAPTEKVLEATVKQKGETVKNPIIVWSSSDENVVAVDQTGKITSVGKGTAIVSATYISVSGTYYSQGVQVDVVAMQMAADEQIILSHRDDYANVLESIAVADIEKITFNEGELQYTVEGNKIVISAEESFKYKEGAFSAIISTEMYDYVVEAIVATATISTKTEFVDLLLNAKTDAWVEDKGFTGYYIFTNDIDLEDMVLNSMNSKGEGVDYCMLTNNKISYKGWQATLNGNGYTLSNVDLGWKNYNALFGEIGTEGVVENLVIRNIHAKGYGGLLAYNNYGTIRNVYLEGAFFYQGNVGAAMPNVMFAAIPREGSVVENCIAIDTSDTYYANTALFGGLLRGDNTIVNCYGASGFTTPEVLNPVLNDKTYAFDAVKYESAEELFTSLTEDQIASLPMLTAEDGNYYWGKTRVYREADDTPVDFTEVIEINYANGEATIDALANKMVTGIEIGGVAVEFVQDGNVFTVVLDGITSGSYDITFKTTSGNYTANCIVVKYITNVEDFKAMLADYKAHIIDLNGFGGYYKMMANLDLASETDGTAKANFRSTYLVTEVDKKNNVAYASKVGENRGWQGTFDGNGYTISNLNMGAQTYVSLFATIGKKGVVKNLSIVSCSAGKGAILAAFNYGTIENVYIEGAFSYTSGTNADFPNGMLVAALENGATVKNCVVKYTGDSDLTFAGIAFGILNKAAVENPSITVENCYVIHSTTMPVVYTNTSEVAVSVNKVSTVAETRNLSMLITQGEDYYWGKKKLN